MSKVTFPIFTVTLSSLDGHNNQVTLDAVSKVRKVGLDLVLKLPSHTSHPLKLLDVAIFKPFKMGWHFINIEMSEFFLIKAAHKKLFAQWVLLSLRKSMS